MIISLIVSSNNFSITVYNLLQTVTLISALPSIVLRGWKILPNGFAYEIYYPKPDAIVSIIQSNCTINKSFLHI